MIEEKPFPTNPLSRLIIGIAVVCAAGSGSVASAETPRGTYRCENGTGLPCCYSPGAGTDRNDTIVGRYCYREGRGGRVSLQDRSNDRIFRLRGNDLLAGLGGNDLIGGGTGNDLLRGGRGNDRLLGGPGNDRLEGGTGRDILDCGPGRDSALTDGQDRLVDCERVARQSSY